MTPPLTRTSLPAQASQENLQNEQTGAEQVFTVAEFFAGIGLARLGLEQAKNLKVAWANDIAVKKQEMYREHFGDVDSAHYECEDIKVIADDPVKAGVPQDLGVAWASFPCTDLSLAGKRKGLEGKHSGTFWDFAAIIDRLKNRGPKVIALENVNGLATSHDGEDLRTLIKELNRLHYSVDVLTLDARRWVPQSRPRLFLIGSKELPELEKPEERNVELRPKWLDRIFEDPDLKTHRARLPALPPLKRTGWTRLVSQIPESEVEHLWWDETRMARFRGELSDVQQARVEGLKALGGVVYRTAYRRTRGGIPQWEIRADDIAGCLRTTGGGSSKQAVVRIEKDNLQARWMTPREYASLMGAPDYKLLDHENQARMGFGDAVCVDAVAWLAVNYIQPLLAKMDDQGAA
ncbi:DNA cytosine methyltransferase [Streptacidiphilus sp. PAMC 29251]